MRKIREVLRLKHVNKSSERAIAKSCCVARSTVADYLWRAAAAGLSWPLPSDLDDESLEQLLFPLSPSVPLGERPLPDWDYVHKELRRKGVTRFLLWQEYKSNNLEGFQYTQFCARYLQWRGRQDPVMRQVHKAGEKLFVDYAGHTVPITDRQTGEVRFAEIFVAVLGASSYLYCEATWSQSLPDWIASHIRAFEFFGGVPEVLVPDNLKAGVTSPHLYEPDLNPTYQDMAVHYGVAVVPARVRRPQDKAKVESPTNCRPGVWNIWLRSPCSKWYNAAGTWERVEKPRAEQFIRNSWSVTCARRNLRCGTEERLAEAIVPALFSADVHTSVAGDARRLANQRATTGDSGQPGPAAFS